MIDIDHFKQVNDTYGHDAGDATWTVCNTLTHNMRPGDTVGRWGGEEFLILAVDITASGLAVFAERCRLLIAESAVSIGSEHLQVTASVGAHPSPTWGISRNGDSTGRSVDVQR